ncbi:Toll/interleukin-1 receptor homology (TIR) domain-containing protein [Hirschfeldia incana]|nr:Toll/interleukin-1 receptor homology (TIR) domain-containing protein [Hirschfeldia incana]
MKDDVLQEGVSCLGSDRSEGIRESKVAVVVVSRSYPISARCLDELQTILSFHDERRISILPIFYGVDEPVVRKQTKELAEPFRNLSKKYPSEKVQAWKIALLKLTNISGQNSRYLIDDGWMVETITSQVLRVLSEYKRVKPRATISRTVSNKKTDTLPTKVLGLVGLDRHMLALKELLDVKSKAEVRFIGIYGQGGVGKTTLARHVYEELRDNFHAHVFVDKAVKICQQVTDESCPEETYTSKEIQEEDQEMTRSLSVEADVIKSKVSHRRSLLVVDCVDNIKQIKDIAEIVGLCCPGSRVILVTQDKKLVDDFGVEHVYEVQPLRYDEALQLFSQSAFKQQHPPATFESLSLRAARVCGFLPLSLKILGSSLQGKDGEYWKKELQKMEGSQEKAIRRVMKKSFMKEKVDAFIFSLI